MKNEKNIKELLTTLRKNIMEKREKKAEGTSELSIEDIDDLKMISKLFTEEQKEMKMKDPIKPILGKGSVDKKWLENYTYGQSEIKNPKKTIYQFMRDNNKKFKDVIAMNYEGNKLTFGYFFEEIEKSCKAFSKLGIKKGDIVTICMPNTPETIISFYALNRIGAVANMIHPLSGENVIKDYINEVDSKVLLTIDIDYEKIKNIINDTNLEHVIVSSAGDSLPFAKKMAYKFFVEKKEKFYQEKPSDKFITYGKFIENGKNQAAVDEAAYENNRMAVMLHTGGTTGTPKGVMLSDDNFNSMVSQFVVNEKNFKRGDIMLTIMPAFHGFGLCSSIHLPLSMGVTIVLIPKFNPKQFDKLFSKYKPNHIIGVPTLYKAMINNKKIKKMDLSNIKYVVSGGDTMKDHFEDTINEFLKSHNSTATLCKGYGLSEAVAGTTFASDGCNKPGSIGIPMIENNFKIIEPGTTRELEYNKPGEICVSGPTVMLGYYNKPEETNKVLKKHEDGKTWLHTGDMGYMDEDGLLYFSQRIKRMIISNGYNVYHPIVEKVIEKHPSVEKCEIVGVPSEYHNEIVKAYIQLKKGYEESNQIQMEIEELCSKDLAKYEMPRIYVFKENIPQTLIGKTNYGALEEENRVSSEKTKILKR